MLDAFQVGDEILILTARKYLPASPGESIDANRFRETNGRSRSNTRR